jgi:hypothetical protein
MMNKVYQIGKGRKATVLTAWPREDLEALACAIFDVCGETVESHPVDEDTKEVDEDTKEEASEIVRKCGDAAAMAFAREVFADLEKH